MGMDDGFRTRGSHMLKVLMLYVYDSLLKQKNKTKPERAYFSLLPWLPFKIVVELKWGNTKSFSCLMSFLIDQSHVGSTSLAPEKEPYGFMATLLTSSLLTHLYKENSVETFSSDVTSVTTGFIRLPTLQLPRKKTTTWITTTKEFCKVFAVLLTILKWTKTAQSSWTLACTLLKAQTLRCTRNLSTVWWKC